jgi:hypothetical protein
VGSELVFEDVAGEFRVRAQVRGVGVGADDVPRVSLMFLDGEMSDERIPADAPELRRLGT